MRNIVKATGIVAALMFAAAGGISKASAAPADNGSIVLVFKDGHRKIIDMSDVARIDFKTPVTLVFKDGHQQSVPAVDISRIEFDALSAGASASSRARFVGKWEVGEGNGGNFYATLDADGEAHKSIGSSHGTWTVVGGEARISWDDGWHDAIRKVDGKYEKFAYEPGKSFDDSPSNVTAARNTEAKPI
jgi:hypothetical protein